MQKGRPLLVLVRAKNKVATLAGRAVKALGKFVGGDKKSPHPRRPNN